MAIPQVERVHLVLHQHVEILHPLGLVVKPREVLRSIGILIDAVSWQVDRLLQSDTCAAHHHIGLFCRRLHTVQ